MEIHFLFSPWACWRLESADCKSVGYRGRSESRPVIVCGHVTEVWHTETVDSAKPVAVLFITNVYSLERLHFR